MGWSTRCCVCASCSSPTFPSSSPLPCISTAGVTTPLYAKPKTPRENAKSWLVSRGLSSSRCRPEGSNSWTWWRRTATARPTIPSSAVNRQKPSTRPNRKHLHRDTLDWNGDPTRRRNEEDKKEGTQIVVDYSKNNILTGPLMSSCLAIPFFYFVIRLEFGADLPTNALAISSSPVSSSLDLESIYRMLWRKFKSRHRALFTRQTNLP